MDTKRILRPEAPLVLCARSVGGSSNVVFTAAPAATAPAPSRTKSLRVIDVLIPRSPHAAQFSLLKPRDVKKLSVARVIIETSLDSSLAKYALDLYHTQQSFEQQDGVANSESSA
jgi:hypothetical protein